MAAKRGLNKGRGLGSLIPNKLDSDKNSDISEKSSSEETSVTVKSTAEKSTDVKAAGTKAAGAKAAAAGMTKTEKTEKTASKAASGKAGKTSASANKVGKSEAKTDKKEENAADQDEIRKLKITQIVPNQEQPRKDFDEESIEELAESIREFGVIQPLLVQKKGRYYEIIAGERRWRAAKKAGIKEVPVIVGVYNEQEVKEISLIENIQREDLNAIEEAEAYKNLMDEFGLTQEQVAQKVGKKRSTVTNSLRLLKLAAPVRHLLLKGDITMGHARALLALEDPEMQVSASHQIIQKKLSVRDTEKLVKTLLNPKKPREKTAVDEQILLAYRNLEDQMQKKFGSKVAIKANGDKGKIEIEYYSQEDLERIIDLLS